MSLDPQSELEHVEAGYARYGRREAIGTLVGLTVVGATSLAQHELNWGLLIGGVVGAVGWELTKLRVRRNARHFADATRR